MWPQKQMDSLPDVAEPSPLSPPLQEVPASQPQAKAAGGLLCRGRWPPLSPGTHSVSENNVLVPVAETTATAPEPLVL